MAHQDHEKNRTSWNQMVDLHVDHLEYLTQKVIDGGSSLKPLIENETLWQYYACDSTPSNGR